MAPQPWATVEQTGWLEARISVFRQHQDNCNVAHFWPGVIREWFEAFPEREALFRGVYGPLDEQQTAELAGMTQKRAKVSSSPWFRVFLPV